MPKLTRKPMDPDSYQRNLEAIAGSIRRSGKKHVFIRIHGGLNALGNSVVNTDSLVAFLGPTSYYPLLINWESSWKSSYFDHLLWVRHGHRYDGWSLFGVPAVLLSDVGRGAVRAPITIYRTLLYTIKDRAWKAPISTRKQYELYRAYEQRSPGDPAPLAYDPGRHEESMFMRTVQSVYSAILLPPHFVTGIVVDAFGTSSWDNMQRTTRTMFHADGEFERPDEENRYRPGTGALARFMRILSARLPRSEGYSITLVGHSMGAIIAGEMLQAARTVPEADLPIDTVVFMAAAATVRQFHDDVVPYLQANPKAQFFNLTLHPIADLREHGPLHLTQGSLLEWIDDYLSTPGTEFDRMMGKSDNIVRASHTIPNEVRGRVRLKTFDYYTPSLRGGYGRDGRKPRKHGEFSHLDVGFWKTPFWMPRRPEPELRPQRSRKDSLESVRAAKAR